MKNQYYIKSSPKKILNTIGVTFIIGTLILSTFIPFAFNQADAAEYYDSGWITVSNSKFHADKTSTSCPNIGKIAKLTANYMGEAWHAWINLNAPKGNYKIDMKLGYDHKEGTLPQYNETITVYSKKDILSTNPPIDYKDRAYVPDMDDNAIRPGHVCEDTANAIETYINVLNKTLEFPDMGDLFLQGTGSSVVVTAIRVHGWKIDPPKPIISISKNVYKTTAFPHVDKITASPGDFISYTLNYKNTGNGQATNVVIRDPFTNQNQNYLTFINSSPAPDYSTTDTWTISQLDPGQTGLITINAQISDVMPEGTTIIKNKFSIETDQTPLLYSNFVQINVYTEPIVLNPDLSISKKVRNVTQGYSWSKSVSAKPGDEVEFLIRIDSIGDDVAQDVYVKDYLPYKLSYVNGSTHGATTSDITSAWRNIGNIPVGSSKTVYFKAKIHDESYFSIGSTTLINKAKTYADDVVTIEDTAQVIVTKNSTPNNPNLSIYKRVKNVTQGYSWSKGVSAKPGDEVEFSIEINSTGDTTAENVYVRDYLPYKLTYINGSTHGATTSDITSGWRNIGNISVGSSKTVYFKAKIHNKDYFSIGSTTLTNQAKTYADDVWTIEDTAKVVVEKEEEKPKTKTMTIIKLGRNINTGQTSFSDYVSAEPSDTIEFSIQVTNTGNATINNLKVWDNLPNDLEYISDSTAVDGSYRSDGIIGNGIYIGTLNPGQTKIIKFKVKIASFISSGSGTIVIDIGSHTVQTSNGVSTNKSGRNISQGQTNWSTSISANINDELEFSIKVINISSSDLHNVKISETLPANLSIIPDSTTVDGHPCGGNITGAGLNLETLNKGQEKTIKFKAKVITSTGAAIAPTTLINTAYANADKISTIYDKASVTVSKSGQVLGATTIETGPVESFILSLIISILITVAVYLILKNEARLRLRFVIAKNRFYSSIIRRKDFRASL